MYFNQRYHSAQSPTPPQFLFISLLIIVLVFFFFFFPTIMNYATMVEQNISDSYSDSRNLVAMMHEEWLNYVVYWQDQTL